jgi:hypothetical protein
MQLHLHSGRVRRRQGSAVFGIEASVYKALDDLDSIAMRDNQDVFG